MKALTYLRKQGFSSFAYVYGPQLAMLSMLAFLAAMTGAAWLAMEL